MIRQPAVAGSFYPSDSGKLSTQITSYLHAGNEPQKVVALVAPHAGYVYSGGVAGEIFAAAEIPRKVILIGPNHRGAGENLAVSGADSWETPLGTIPVASVLREQLVKDVFPLVVDDTAHQYEHSLEVMLPFLQRRQPELEIVPILVGQLSLTESLQLGSAISQMLTHDNEEVLLVASSDMNHFVTAERTQQLDFMAIEAMEKYDLQRLYHVVREKHISMCGVLPVIIVMQAAHGLGARKCQLLRYAHSGQVNGDNDRVVGYAGLMIQ